MATAKQTKRDRLRAYVDSRAPGAVAPDEWLRILEMLAPVSESRLRQLLREMATPMEPLVAGVDQSSFQALEASLLALLQVYQQGSVRACRKLVIQAKDHARWASRRAKDEAKRWEKQEMAAWMRVWLENPAVFPPWARMRRADPRFRQSFPQVSSAT
ncbi:MAG: hypothetical protein NT090_01685 [Acidobacteria bacterium]|nr:hypothetical protein [Acidobacteriota bacterium]